MKTVEELFHAALQIQDPLQRDSFLNQACGEDQRLRDLIESLLRADASTDAFFGTEQE